MTKRERQDWLYRLEQLSQGFKDAVAARDPNQAFAVHDVPRLKFQCTYCDYAREDKCTEGWKSKKEQQTAAKERYKEYRRKK